MEIDGSRPVHIQDSDLFEIVYTPGHPDGSWALRDLASGKNAYYQQSFTRAVELCARLNGRNMPVDQEGLA